MVGTRYAGAATTEATPEYIFVMSTAAHAGTPDFDSGDYISFYAKKIKLLYKNTDKRTVIAGHKAQKYLSDKFDCGVEGSEIIIVKQAQADLVAEVEHISDFLYKYGSKSGAAKIYCWVYHTAAAKYVQLGITAADTRTYYLYGRPEPCDIELGTGLIAYADTIIFREVNL